MLLIWIINTNEKSNSHTNTTTVCQHYSILSFVSYDWTSTNHDICNCKHRYAAMCKQHMQTSHSTHTHTHARTQFSLSFSLCLSVYLSFSPLLLYLFQGEPHSGHRREWQVSWHPTPSGRQRNPCPTPLCGTSGAQDPGQSWAHLQHMNATFQLQPC